MSANETSRSTVRTSGVVWEDLVSTALLGTERRPLPATSTPMDSAIRASANTEAVAVLTFGGLLGVSRRATLATTQNTSGPDSDGPDASGPDSGATINETRREVSTTASQLLDLLLGGSVATGGQHDRLIGQWLEGCNRHQQRTTRSQILPLLERATNNTNVQSDAAQVIGERGAFLSRKNSRWRWVQEERSSAQFSNDDTPVERDAISVDALVDAEPSVKEATVRRWRTSDPDRARDAVAEAMTREPAPERIKFISALTTNLSSADETLLESALDDRAKGVREAARTVLAQLPNSAFVNRMIGRLEPLVRTRRIPRFSVTVSLPEIDLATKTTESAAWVRDGFAADATKAETLNTLVTHVPVAWWERHLDRKLPEVIERLVGTDTQHEVINGILRSAVNVGRDGLSSTEWIVGLWMDLLDLATKSQQSNSWDVWWQDRMLLLALMTPAEVTSLLDLASQRGLHQQDFIHVLGAQDHALADLRSAAIPPAVADRIGRALAAAKPDAQYIIINQPNFPLVLTTMSESVFTDLLASTESDQLTQRLRHLQAANSLSNAIAKEFP